MTLILDHQQRLNLSALMGAQKGSVAEIRQLWKMQDRLELSEEEKRTINLRTILQNGAEGMIWDRDAKLPPASYDFTESEIQRIRKLIEEWPAFSGNDRMWVESTLEQLDSLQTPTSKLQ